MLEAENLVKQFEKNEKKHKKVLFSAVDHVSLHIKEGGRVHSKLDKQVHLFADRGRAAAAFPAV